MATKREIIIDRYPNLEKNKPYFIVCAKGTKSRKAVSILEFYGYDVTQMSYEN